MFCELLLPFSYLWQKQGLVAIRLFNARRSWHRHRKTIDKEESRGGLLEENTEQLIIGEQLWCPSLFYSHSFWYMLLSELSGMTFEVASECEATRCWPCWSGISVSAGRPFRPAARSRGQLAIWWFLQLSDGYKTTHCLALVPELQWHSVFTYCICIIELNAKLAWVLGKVHDILSHLGASGDFIVSTGGCETHFFSWLQSSGQP